MIGEASGHRGRDAQALMNPAEVVVHEVQGNHRIVILNLFAECIGEPGNPTLT
jgi:hypothetical protein